MDAKERIARLKAELATKDARLAEQDARLAEQEAQLAAKDARIEELEGVVAKLTEQIALLTKRVEELTEELKRNSSNSNLPPSSDPPGGQRKPGKTPKGAKGKGKRKRGGQPGHRGSKRQLVPEDQVDTFVNHFPDQCRNCWNELPEIPDPAAKRYQVTEVPPIRPHITEHRRHAVKCPCCGYKTRAPYDEANIPSSPFGPRLMSLVVLLTGIYHVSRRKTATLLKDMVGVKISVGAISAIEGRMSKAVEPVVAEVCEHVERAKIKHTDGTGWLKSGVAMSLWTIATKTATVFKILNDGSAASLKPLFGNLRGILVSDRAKALGFWAIERRQICWAHLLRKFVSFSERDGPAGTFGCQLLNYTGILFEYWQEYKAGRLDKATLLAWIKPVRVQMEALLTRASAAGIEHLSGSCADILAHKDALWTFLACNGVDPTNNHAEQQLRAFVLWRRRSFGTRSDRGNRFAERIMTVAHTARKQRKDVLTVLTACRVASQTNTAAPSLFDANFASAA